MRKNIKTIAMAIVGLSLVGCTDISTSSSTSTVNDASIKVYTRDTTSGTRDGFFTAIGLSSAKEDNTPLVSGYIEVASNGDMISGIQNDEYGIGYISLATLESSNLKGLTYEGVEPNEDNVLNLSYGLTRNFNYIVRTEFTDTKVEEIVDAFEAFLTTVEAKTTMIGKDGILSVSASDPSWDTIKSNYPVCSEDNSAVTIKFGGSTSVEKMAKALSAEFSPLCGNFVAEHNHTGSGDAFKRTQGSEKDGANKIDIGFASREFKLTDGEAATTGSYAKMCTDAIAVVVNSANTVTNLTAAQLYSVYTGTVTKWSELE